MATSSKNILTVDLYDNVLTEKPGDYTGRIRITGTVRNRDIAEAIVKERTEYRLETIENILNLADQKKREALALGRSLVDGVGQSMLTIGGSFSGKRNDWKSEDNRISVSFTPGAELLKLMDNIYVNADVATVGPVIDSITDSTTQKQDSLLTSGAPAIIHGSHLLIKGDDPAVGIHFTPTEGGDAIPVSLIVGNTQSQIIISLPTLPDGTYYLSVTTQAGAGYKLVKEPRTFKFPLILTAGKAGTEDDGTEDRPENL